MAAYWVKLIDSISFIIDYSSTWLFLLLSSSPGRVAESLVAIFTVNAACISLEVCTFYFYPLYFSLAYLFALVGECSGKISEVEQLVVVLSSVISSSLKYWLSVILIFYHGFFITSCILNDSYQMCTYITKGELSWDD